MNARKRHTYSIDDDESLTESVIRAVSAVTGKQPMQLQPLHGSIDTDALDAFFTRSSGGETGVKSLSIIYEGCRIEVDHETIVVEEIPTA